ncbi:inhibits MHC class II antigen presentation [Yokapox virus]|uniref:Inhibits MHC class II antigen presentation n=1 Tax=Yokapox virus TaxID=1076255 RepID=G3EI33_9POXV|nr:inhibits MHC class II antigen presentation [Yokapox virus]AEN03730.1 inhibits MHC class II antigen presentation [Yokapox virus]
MEEYTSIVTPLGVFSITDELFDDVNIKIIDIIGPYLIGVLDAVLSSQKCLISADINRLYFAYKGKVAHSSSDDVLMMPTYNICNVYMSKNSFIVTCDYDIMLSLKDKMQQFYLFPSVDILNAKVIEVYNLYRYGDYNLIINPSNDLLLELSLKSTFCLSDGYGWVIADGKRNFSE